MAQRIRNNDTGFRVGGFVDPETGVRFDVSKGGLIVTKSYEQQLSMDGYSHYYQGRASLSDGDMFRVAFLSPVIDEKVLIHFFFKIWSPGGIIVRVYQESTYTNIGTEIDALCTNPNPCINSKIRSLDLNYNRLSVNPVAGTYGPLVWQDESGEGKRIVGEIIEHRKGLYARNNTNILFEIEGTALPPANLVTINIDWNDEPFEP